ncbi:class I SAM-dependent methyltransferase [Methanolobus zinderi]|uniref:Class I SAM-dependent methyltransferase n=1 Tax=Methanolobus zinderi TaxID=536044 RepID=A0A7D5I3R5_9EURY|nr:class I SAM-dependent methyltransferase [Methanolobus zinderi]QLC49141.1 class I SAM-dependent methyltransferase [Methanolobus zinderi]
MENRSNSWSGIKAEDIPTTIELDPVLYKYTTPGCRVLDIGCGTGKVTIPLASRGFSLTGVDINAEALKIALYSCKSEKFLQNPLFTRSDATNLPFSDATFDMAIMQAFLTTVTSKEGRVRIIREACRVLKPEGHLYLADFGQTWHSKIYRERYINDLPVTKEEGSIIAYDKEAGEIAYIAHHFTEKELVLLLVENSFEVDFFKRDTFVTRTGNRINGFIVVGRKV